MFRAGCYGKFRGPNFGKPVFRALVFLFGVDAMLFAGLRVPFFLVLLWDPCERLGRQPHALRHLLI